MRFWDIATGAERSVRQLRTGYGPHAGFGTIRPTADGRYLVTPNWLNEVSDDKPVLVWDARTGAVVLPFDPKALGRSWSVIPTTRGTSGTRRRAKASC